MVRETAADTIWRAPKSEPIVTALLAALDDDYWQVRLKSTRSLGKLRVAEAIDRIGPYLSLEQANLRKETAAALGEIALPAGRPYLEPFTDDNDPDVRKNVRWALEQIEKQETASSQ